MVTSNSASTTLEKYTPSSGMIHFSMRIVNMNGVIVVMVVIFMIVVMVIVVLVAWT